MLFDKYFLKTCIFNINSTFKAIALMLYKYIIFIFHDVVKVVLCVGQLWPALQYRNRKTVSVYCQCSLKYGTLDFLVSNPEHWHSLMQFNKDYTSGGNPIGEERNDSVGFK